MQLNQAAMAERLSISAPYLCQIELGERRPGPVLMLSIMDLTGIPMRAWMEEISNLQIDDQEQAGKSRI